MINKDAILHVCGKSQYIENMPVPAETLFGAICTSTIAHGIIKSIDISAAQSVKGVKKIFLAKDIPGENQIGHILPDELLLAKDRVSYIGQPVCFVVATNFQIAHNALSKIVIEYEELKPVFDPRIAYEKGNIIVQPRIFALGDIKKAWKNCDIIINGKVYSKGQEHVYLETQSSIAYPSEQNGIKISSSTQSLKSVQQIVSQVLDIPMHRVEVDITRLGGAFGGKEGGNAICCAALTSLAAYTLKKPIKLVLNRSQDIKITGKRHPYSSDYKLGLKNDGKILAYEVVFFQNAGATTDHSLPILERSLFHATNSYYIPNVKATGICCKTNLPSNTAFRGFGAPQSVFVIEAAIDIAAKRLGIEKAKLQEINLIKKSDKFSYGMKLSDDNLSHCWNKTKKLFYKQKRIKSIKKFNQNNKLIKKGISLMPVCFGISFTHIPLNQANALVQVYVDGSIGISTCAVEMGQGVNAKIAQIAANIFSIDIEKISIFSTNTTRNANSSPTAASSAADLNGNATKIACLNILKTIKKAAKKILNADKIVDIEIKDEIVICKNKKTDLTWDKLVAAAYEMRLPLFSHAHYKTPYIFFDKKTEKGKPFAYHVCGAAVTEVSLDCLRGTYEIESVEIVHDFGNSINKLIDLGQIEGGLLQGIGWATLEELVYSDKGKLLTDNLATYKIPDIYSTPKNIDVTYLDKKSSTYGVMGSKAVGEPPFIYGIGAYFAILNAMREFNPNIANKYEIPMTPENVLLLLYNKETI